MLIIFDLDGTLIDSSQDLAISTNATRAHFGLPALSQAVINSYVGNGAGVLVEKAMGSQTARETVADALTFFLQYYRTHSLQHTRLYDGIRAALEALAEEHDLSVLTNKPQKISFDILAALGVQKFFRRVIGGDSLERKKPDPMGILELMREADTSNEATLMVGDSSVDVLTARNAGVRSCGVRWGFQPDTFEAVSPDFQIHTPGELSAIVFTLISE